MTNDELRKHLGEAIVLYLQGDISKFDRMARTVKLEFPYGEPVVKTDQGAFPLRTYSKTFAGFAHALMVVIQVTQQSQWFEFTPLPDDEYEIAVKEENRAVLDSYSAFCHC